VLRFGDDGIGKTVSEGGELYGELGLFANDGDNTLDLDF
jgi:hypothetical protein